MQKIFVITGAALLCAMTAGATDYARYEVFAGYDWFRFNPNSPFVPSFNANGGNGQVVINFNRWLGGEFDGGAATKGTLNHFNVDTTVVNFVAGPRVTFGHQGRFRPFVHALFGGAYNTASAQFSTNIPANPIFPPGFMPNPNAPITTRLVASNTNFAMMVGGGLDWKWTKHVYFRPIGADYYLTRVPNNIWGNGSTTNRNNFRYSAGINFVWGEPK